MSENVLFHGVLSSLTNAPIERVERFVEHFVRISPYIFVKVFGNMIEFDFLFRFADCGNYFITDKFADFFDIYVQNKSLKFEDIILEMMRYIQKMSLQVKLLRSIKKDDLSIVTGSAPYLAAVSGSYPGA